MKFKCKENFSYSGFQMSINDSDLEFFKESMWKKDEIYDGRYYDGGVLCPVQGYFILSENKNEYIFTIQEAKPTYMLISEHFEIIKDF